MTTFDFVDDLEADPTGSNPSDDALASINEFSGTIDIDVPGGQYHFSAEEHVIDGPTRVTFIGEPSDTTEFIAPGLYTDRWITFETDGGLIDLSIDRTGVLADPQIELKPTRESLLTRVDVQGYGDGGINNSGGTFVVNGDPQSDTGFRDVSIRGGGDRAGILVHPNNDGSVWVSRSRIDDHAYGIDAAFSTNPLDVENSIFVNNGHAGIRHAHPEDHIKNSVFVIDPDRAQLAPSTLMRGIWLSTGGLFVTEGLGSGLDPGEQRYSQTYDFGGIIEGCDFRIDSGAHTTVQGAICGGDDAPGVVVASTDIEVEPDGVPAVYIVPESIGEVDTSLVNEDDNGNYTYDETPSPVSKQLSSGEIVLDDVLIRGSSKTGAAIEIPDRVARIISTGVETPAMKALDESVTPTQEIVVERRSALNLSPDAVVDDLETGETITREGSTEISGYEP